MSLAVTLPRDTRSTMAPPRKTSRSTFAVMGSIWIVSDGHAFLGQGRVALLEEIGSSGSISEAARNMGMSYKKAWRLVEAMNAMAEVPLVVRTSGGQGGGGTLLTDKGRHMIHSFRLIESEFRTFLDEMTKRTELRQPASAK